MKLFCPTVLFHTTCVQLKVVNGKSLMKFRVFIKKQITKPSLIMKIFWPAGNKSLRLRSAVFEVELRHGVWGSSFKCFSTACAKTNSSLFGESR